MRKQKGVGNWLGTQGGSGWLRHVRRGSWPKTLCIGLGLLAACGKLDRERPHVTRVVPGIIRQGSVQALSVEGENFYAMAEVKLATPDQVSIKTNFRVLIDNTEVPIEGPVTPTQLTIKSTANLALGGHSVTVVTPEGYSDTLLSAFSVSDPGVLSAAPTSMNSGGTAPNAGGMNNANTGASSSLGGQMLNLSGGANGAGGTGVSSGGVFTGAGGSFSAGGSGGVNVGSGGASIAAGGSGGALVGGCLEYDTLSTLCIHSCKLLNPTTIDYCNMIFFADVADCVYSNAPNPDTCEQGSGTKELEVGLDRPSVGARAQAYLSFNIDRLPPNGRPITAVYLVLSSSRNTLAPSNSTGSLWFSEPFTRSDLFTKTPLAIGANPIGPDLGTVGRYQQVGWTLQPGVVTIPGRTYMTITPNSKDSVHYYNLKELADRPYLQVEYQ